MIGYSRYVVEWKKEKRIFCVFYVVINANLFATNNFIRATDKGENRLKHMIGCKNNATKDKASSNTVHVTRSLCSSDDGVFSN